MNKNIIFSILILIFSTSGVLAFGQLIAPPSAVNGSFVPYVGGIDNLNLTGFNITAENSFYSGVEAVSLTVTGSALIQGLITSESIVPALDSLYSIGNSTNWFNEIFVRDVYSDRVNATNITSANIKSKYVNSTSIDTETIDFGSATINKTGDDFTITLN